MERALVRLYLGQRVVVLQCRSGDGRWDYEGRRLPWFGMVPFDIPYAHVGGCAIFMGRWLLALTAPIPIMRPRYALKWVGGG